MDWEFQAVAKLWNDSNSFSWKSVLKKYSDCTNDQDSKWTSGVSDHSHSLYTFTFWIIRLIIIRTLTLFGCLAIFKPWKPFI